MIAIHLLRFTASIYGVFYALTCTALLGSSLACRTLLSARQRLRKTARTALYGAPMVPVSMIEWAYERDFVSSINAAYGGMILTVVLTVPVCMVIRGVRKVHRADRRAGRLRLSPLVSVAAAVAGEGRNLRGPWLADLAGDPASGVALTERQRRHMAVGFLIAAFRMRAADVTRPVWRRIDWLLSREERTNALITATAGALAIYFAVTDGVHALITADWQSCAGLGGGLYVLARWLRRIRGIELAERERRRDRAS